MEFDPTAKMNDEMKAFAAEILSNDLFARLPEDGKRIEWDDENDSRFRWSIRMGIIGDIREWHVTYDNRKYLHDLYFERKEQGERPLTFAEQKALLIEKNSIIYEKKRFKHGYLNARNDLLLGDFYFMRMHIRINGIRYC